MSKDEFDVLKRQRVPAASDAARRRAVEAALAVFDENNSAVSQGSRFKGRHSTGAVKLWSWMMNRKILAAPAVATILALPLAGYTAYYLSSGSPLALRQHDVAVEERATMPATDGAVVPAKTREVSPTAPAAEPAQDEAAVAAPAVGAGAPAQRMTAEPGAVRMLMQAPRPAVVGHDMSVPPAPARDRLESFDSNPVKVAAESPVSTFSVDVDTASYALVRSSLTRGVLPDPATVRVEELVNYFPYDWQGPESAGAPFRPTVTVMPTPWNAHTRLMHVAIKGYDLPAAENPRSNLVLLVDTSGSMNEPDKLPLLKSAFRLLVERMGADDTISIVAYAGSAGTVLEPTKGSEKAKILDALENLQSGGSTAGEAGLREAYRLARESYVEGGVNRVMLATDGDFNVGQTSDEELTRLIEEERESGVFLSVFGFGRGNYNDRMMQAIAQNGNGVAAYIDTLAEAEKTMVQEASSTLFPIAADVKIQVEFNPEKIAEYRLIGYETRALAREDFNNDRVDAGDIGSGHSVTAIYEITPADSPVRVVDDLRYGGVPAGGATGNAAADDEYAYVKIRYKLPGENASRLIETPVGTANEVAKFDQAGIDQRFSVAVAAFGQKLRDADQMAGFGFDRILEMAGSARGDDPFGYRAEFLRLVRLAAALDGSRR